MTYTTSPKRGPLSHLVAREHAIGNTSNAGYGRIWRGETSMVKRLKLTHTVKAHRGCVNTINWNSSGSLLVSGSDDTKICVYDYDEDYRTLHTIDSGHSANIFTTKFLPFNDDRIISCAGDGEIRTFHNHQLDQVYGCHDSRVKKLATLTSDPFVFLSVGEDATVRLFDLRAQHVCEARKCANALVKTRALFSTSPTNSSSSSLSLSLSSSSSSNSNSNSNSSSSSVLQEKRKKPHSVELYSIAVDPMNQNYFVVGGGDPYLRLYDRRVLSTSSPEDAPIVKLFCPPSLQERDTVRMLGGCHITGVAYSWNGRDVLASYSGDKIFMFDVKESTGVSLDLPDSDENNNNNNNNNHNNNNNVNKNKQKETADDKSSSKRQKTSDDEAEDEPVWHSVDEIREKVEHEKPYYSKEYSGHCNVRTVKEVNFFGPHSDYVMSGSDCGRIFIWDAKTGKLANMLRGDKHVVNCLSGHPYDMVLASSGIESNLKIWEPFSEELANLNEANDVTQQNLERSNRVEHVPLSMLHLLLRHLHPRRSGEEGEGEEDTEIEGGDDVTNGNDDDFDDSDEEGGAIGCRTQ